MSEMAPTAAEQLRVEYDHSGSEPTSGEVQTLTQGVLDAIHPPEKPKKPVPPKDPVTGQFVKPNNASSQHRPSMVRLAESMGLRPDDIADLSPDVLEQTLAALANQRTPNPQAPNWNQALSTPTPPSVTATPGEEFSIPDLKEADWDPTLIGPLKKLLAGLDKRLRVVEVGHAQLQQQALAQANMSTAQKVDTIFNRWNDSRFGQGGLEDLDPESGQALARHAVVDAARNMAVRKFGSNATLPQILGMFEIVRNKLYGTAKPKEGQESGGAGPTQEEWDAAGLRQPTNRNGSPEPPGRKRAMETVRRIQAQAGSDQGEESGGGEPQTLDRGGNEEDTLL